MHSARAPLFCDTALAERIERAVVDLMAACTRAAQRRRRDGAGFVIPIAGGVACFAERDSPFNKVAGLGFAGAPATAALDEIEHAYLEHGGPVSVELSNLAQPAIATLLTARGFRLVSYENVLGRALERDLEREIERVIPAGVEVRPSGDDELDAWIDVVTDGFAHPDEQGVPSHEEFPREVIANAERDFAQAGVVRYAALREGVLAGGGSVLIADGVAHLARAATAPGHRRRGVQTALLSARLADAAAAGCDLAVVTTQPGSRSQHNVQRRGFDLLYTRAVLMKDPQPTPPPARTG